MGENLRSQPTVLRTFCCQEERERGGTSSKSKVREGFSQWKKYHVVCYIGLLLLCHKLYELSNTRVMFHTFCKSAVQAELVPLAQGFSRGCHQSILGILPFWSSRSLSKFMWKWTEFGSLAVTGLKVPVSLSAGPTLSNQVPPVFLCLWPHKVPSLSMTAHFKASRRNSQVNKHWSPFFKKL